MNFDPQMILSLMNSMNGGNSNNQNQSQGMPNMMDMFAKMNGDGGGANNMAAMLPMFMGMMNKNNAQGSTSANQTNNNQTSGSSYNPFGSMGMGNAKTQSTDTLNVDAALHNMFKNKE